MAQLKKIDPNWYPSENRGLRVGEIIEITDYPALVKSGAAVLVDNDGNEMPMPGLKFPCPICFHETTNLKEFTDHVATKHKTQETPTTNESEVEAPKVEEVEEVETETPKEEAPLYVAKPKVVKGTQKTK